MREPGRSLLNRGFAQKLGLSKYVRRSQNIRLKCFILSKLLQSSLNRIGDMPGPPMVYDGHAFN